MDIRELQPEMAKEVQTLLNNHGYGLIVDGIVGEKTTQAFVDFKKKKWLGKPYILGQTTLEKLREKPQGHNFSTKQGTIKAIVFECKRQGLNLRQQIAYVLATTEWETARTFKPVKEGYWIRNAEAWRRKNLRYYPYDGRGFVQLTWKSNYAKYSKILGVDLVSHPDQVCDPNVALFILVHGCKNGTFTGVSIPKYINSHKVDYRNARRVINGTDKSYAIAQLAYKWDAELRINQLA